MKRAFCRRNPAGCQVCIHFEHTRNYPIQALVAEARSTTCPAFGPEPCALRPSVIVSAGAFFALSPAPYVAATEGSSSPCDPVLAHADSTDTTVSQNDMRSLEFHSRASASTGSSRAALRAGIPNPTPISVQTLNAAMMDAVEKIIAIGPSPPSAAP